MGRTIPQRLFVLLTSALMAHVSATDAAAQYASFQQRIATLQRQNAYQQQQVAIQLAVQQTNILLFDALQQNVSGQETGVMQTLNFQPQVSALQTALNQTTLLQQSNVRVGSPVQSPLQQASALQNALQTTRFLQASSQFQGGTLTDQQIQTLFLQKASLIGLLAAPSPQLIRPTPGR